jgi:hypothetical protein
VGQRVRRGEAIHGRLVGQVDRAVQRRLRALDVARSDRIARAAGEQRVRQALLIQPGAQPGSRRRAVEVVGEVLLARPDQLHRPAAGFQRDAHRLRNNVHLQPSAEAATDRLAHAHRGAATAQVVDGRIDLGIARVAPRRQQSGRRHEHTALAVAALRHLARNPCPLERVQHLARGEAFDRAHRPSLHRCERRQAGAPSLAIDVHCAGPADADAAAVLGARELQHVAQRPEQRHGEVDILVRQLALLAVD